MTPPCLHLPDCVLLATSADSESTRRPLNMALCKPRSRLQHLGAMYVRRGTSVPPVACCPRHAATAASTPLKGAAQSVKNVLLGTGAQQALRISQQRQHPVNARPASFVHRALRTHFNCRVHLEHIYHRQQAKP